MNLNYIRSMAYQDRLRMYEQLKQSFQYLHPESTHEAYQAEINRLTKLLKI